MSTLYQIDQEIMQCLDMETGEIIDIERLNALQMDRVSKIEGVALAVKNTRILINGFDAEIKALQERKENALKQAEGWKNWLIMACNGQKFSTLRCEVSFRKNPGKVEVIDQSKIPPELLTVKTEYKPDKKAIGELLKSGVEVAGCCLKDGISTTIK